MQPAKMQPIVYLSITIIIMAAVCMSPAVCIPVAPTETAETAKNSTPCSIEVERICSAIDATDNYSMGLGVDKFHHTGEIKVQVHATQCVLSNTHLPWWYQIEVIEILESKDSGSGHHDQEDAGDVSGSGSEDGARKVGRFRIPRRKHEMAVCNQGSTVAFSSCSPTLFDLPREITWTSPNKYSDMDSLCFRLTVQLSGDRSCSRKEVCISIGDIPRPPQNSGVSSNQDDTITYVQIVEDTKIGSANLVEFEPGMDDEDMLKLIKEKYDIDDTDLGVVVPANKGCLLAQEFYTQNQFDWTPDCTCEGYYKAVQCNEVEDARQCWCSSPSGSEIQNTRRTLNCTDPHSFDFKC